MGLVGEWGFLTWRYRAILLEPTSTEVRKKIKGGKRSNKSCVFVEDEPIIV